MNEPRASVALAVLAVACLACGSASAQFLDEFTGPTVQSGWTWFTGDGRATVDFRLGDGHGTMVVDGTKDRDNIWWALIKRNVASFLDLVRLKQPGHELRLEARVRLGNAPRRMHLSVNTQKTTDCDEHLREFDIPDTTGWHTISMTTKDFRAEPGDEVNIQFAVTDWGLGKYQAEIDYFKVDVVDVATAGPDKGDPQVYHPLVPDLSAFSEKACVAQDSMVNLQYPDLNLNNWYAGDDGRKVPALTVDGVQFAILRWDLSRYSGKRVAAAGVLELTTHAVQVTVAAPEELGQVRVTEILGGDPSWDQRTVTLDSLSRGQPLDAVINPQMIIDERVAEGRGAKTLISISRPVLQRLLDGKSLGLAIRPLGPISATFYASEHDGGRSAATLHFGLQKE